MIIRRIVPISAAKVAATLYALLGLFFGVLFSLAAMAGAGFGRSGSPFSSLFGVGAIVILPLVYGCLGFIMMWITASLYNLAANWVGGLNIEVE